MLACDFVFTNTYAIFNLTLINEEDYAFNVNLRHIASFPASRDTLAGLIIASIGTIKNLNMSNDNH